MAILSSVVSTLSTFYQDSDDPHDAAQVQLCILRLMAKIPTIAAYSHKKSIGQPFLYPDNRLDLIENFLTMMFAVPSEPYAVSPTVVHALKQLLILHADHEQNCSTSTVRMVGSSDANLFASIAAGINALWGPLHGGANQAVIEMLEGIRDGGGDLEGAVRRAKDPNDPFRLSGFGHRVYKNYDPRARILKNTADRVISELHQRDELLDIALALEEIALSDEYFIERKLYPNVDFYSGLIYRAMGFPTQIFTVLFAMGRLPGWIAHWKEMMESPKTKIGRPRQIYTGPTERPYVPLDQR
jgi:citrate synthase